MRKRPLNKNKYSNPAYWLAAAVLVTAAVLLMWVFKDQAKKTTIIPSSHPVNNTGGANKSGSQTGAANSNTSSSSDKSTNAAAGSGAAAGPLKAPYGDFVSNHSPSLSDSSLSQEYSICNTTPGASCYIKFTKDNEIKQLDSVTADSTGAAYWQWNINDAGLSSGDWTITAAAALNGQSQSTQDKRALSIRP